MTLSKQCRIKEKNASSHRRGKKPQTTQEASTYFSGNATQGLQEIILETFFFIEVAYFPSPYPPAPLPFPVSFPVCAEQVHSIIYCFFHLLTYKTWYWISALQANRQDANTFVLLTNPGQKKGKETVS